MSHTISEWTKKELKQELSTLRHQLAAEQEARAKAEAAQAEQFRLYCEETKKHNATAALLAKTKEDFDYAAKALTEHAEAVGVSPDHIDYIDLTTKAIIDAWANKTALTTRLQAAEAELERVRQSANDDYSALMREATRKLATAEAKAALAERKARILDWLHTGGGPSFDGWEYGVARCKFDQYGKLTNYEWTFSDHSDVEAAMAHDAALTASSPSEAQKSGTAGEGAR